MEKISMWKRVGGWLRRSQGPVGGGKVVRVDAEGMLFEQQDMPDEEESSVLTTQLNKKHPELAALEHGFGRLVEVLESINENVEVQRSQGAQLKEQMDGLGKWLKTLPEGGQSQAAIKELTEEIRKHALRDQQLVETVGTLPELTQAQIDKLAEITQQLEASGQADEQMAETFKCFDNTVQGVLESSKVQSASLGNMSATMERNEEQLQNILSRQNRRIFWMLSIFAVLSLALIGVAVMLFLLRNN